MGNKFKDIGIKCRTYHVFDDMINIKQFELIEIKTDEKVLLITAASTELAKMKP